MQLRFQQFDVNVDNGCTTCPSYVDPGDSAHHKQDDTGDKNVTLEDAISIRRATDAVPPHLAALIKHLSTNKSPVGVEMLYSTREAALAAASGQLPSDSEEAFVRLSSGQASIDDPETDGPEVSHVTSYIVFTVDGEHRAFVIKSFPSDTDARIDLRENGDKYIELYARKHGFGPDTPVSFLFEKMASDMNHPDPVNPNGTAHNEGDEEGGKDGDKDGDKEGDKEGTE